MSDLIVVAFDTETAAKRLRDALVLMRKEEFESSRHLPGPAMPDPAF